MDRKQRILRITGTAAITIFIVLITNDIKLTFGIILYIIGGVALWATLTIMKYFADTKWGSWRNLTLRNREMQGFFIFFMMFVILILGYFFLAFRSIP